jgi:hypothetical protein
MFRDNVSIVDGSGKKAKRTQIERILVLLLESGILYFLFFVGPLLVLFAGSSSEAICTGHTNSACKSAGTR